MADLLINCGSGQRPFPKPWVNVDVQERWEPDVLADCRSMPMFQDNSAAVIVLHQVIEHFGLGECDGCIAECCRILKPGGSLIVTTVDLTAIVKAWIRHEIDDYIFCVNLYGAYMGDEADRHKWLYTGLTLAAALMKAANWSKVKSFDWRPIEGAEIARSWWVLGIEAVK